MLLTALTLYCFQAPRVRLSRDLHVETEVGRSEDPGGQSYSDSVRILAVLPILTAFTAVWCAMWPTARRFVWPVLALAAINVILTPLTSGEWAYQRVEDASYEQAVAKGDFSGFGRLLAHHDPHLHPRMVAMAVVLLVSLAGLAMLQVRRSGGARTSPALSRGAVGFVLLAAAVTAVQGGLLLVG
jgi:hypothetical protein